MKKLCFWKKTVKCQSKKNITPWKQSDFFYCLRVKIFYLLKALCHANTSPRFFYQKSAKKLIFWRNDQNSKNWIQNFSLVDSASNSTDCKWDFSIFLLGGKYQWVYKAWGTGSYNRICDCLQHPTRRNFEGGKQWFDSLYAYAYQCKLRSLFTQE